MNTLLTGHMYVRISASVRLDSASHPFLQSCFDLPPPCCAHFVPTPAPWRPRHSRGATMRPCVPSAGRRFAARARSSSAAATCSTRRELGRIAKNHLLPAILLSWQKSYLNSREAFIVRVILKHTEDNYSGRRVVLGCLMEGNDTCHAEALSQSNNQHQVTHVLVQWIRTKSYQLNSHREPTNCCYHSPKRSKSHPPHSSTRNGTSTSNHNLTNRCLASFEKFLRAQERSCPLCRKVDYQKRATRQGQNEWR